MRIRVDARAERMLGTSLRCHAEGHAWVRTSEFVTATNRRGVITEIEVIRVCASCEAGRVETYSIPTFKLVKRRYAIPKEYRVTRVKGDPTTKLRKQDYVAAYLSRELKELLS